MFQTTNQNMYLKVHQKHMHVYAVTRKKMLTQKKTSTQIHIYAQDVPSVYLTWPWKITTFNR